MITSWAPGCTVAGTAKGETMAIGAATRATTNSKAGQGLDIGGAEPSFGCSLAKPGGFRRVPCMDGAHLGRRVETRFPN